MVKRKLEAVILSDDLDSLSEVYARASRHRSCWHHMIASSYAHKMHTSRRKADEWLQNFKFQCDFGTFPTSKRSNRRHKYKNKIAKEIKEKKKLDTGEFDSYFQNLWKSIPEEQRNSFTYLDSMWFNLYLKASFKEKVLTWIKKKQIFLKKYVLVPIVCWGHWSLLIFCHLGESSKSEARTPCMLLLDSMAKTDPRRLEPNIRKFVLDIYRSEGRAENRRLINKIPLLLPKVPQQKNGEECGSYVLYYISLFVNSAPPDFDIKEFLNYMNQNWFSAERLERFLEELESFEK